MNKFKKFIYHWLEDEDNPNLWITSTILTILVLASIIFIMIEEILLTNGNRIVWLENTFLVIFALEYLFRIFSIDLKFRSEFEKDKPLSFKRHLLIRLKWMVTPYAIIDLISLVPNVRILRLFRVFRAFKLMRYMGSITIFLRGIKSGWVHYIVLITATTLIVTFGSIGIFLAEHDASSGNYDSYIHTLLHVLNIFGLTETTPQTVLGKLLSTGILLYNMVFFGFIISFVNQKMEQTMGEIKKGHLGKLKLKKHICILGSPKNIDYIIKDLKHYNLYMNKIVVLSELEGPDSHNVITVTGDFTDKKWLDYINIKEAEVVIIMSEKHPEMNNNDIDLRNILTLYKVNDIIEQNKSNTHIILEVLELKNLQLINNTKYKSLEIISKDLIDSLLISNSINIHNSSHLFKKLLGITDKDLFMPINKKNNNKIKSQEERLLIKSLKEISSSNVKTLKDLRLDILDKRIQIMGVINYENNKIKSIDPNPLNSLLIREDMRFIVYGTI